MLWCFPAAQIFHSAVYTVLIKVQTCEGGDERGAAHIFTLIIIQQLQASMYREQICTQKYKSKLFHKYILIVIELLLKNKNNLLIIKLFISQFFLKQD
jgi:hypothetical protein